MAGKAEGAGLFFVCNPNNPTGSHVTAAALADFVGAVKAAAPEARVLVDEAYFEYVEDPAYATAVPLALADRRVVVTRTFSKLYGMAGLRVGYAVGHPDTLAALQTTGARGVMTGGMSSASLAAAGAALVDARLVAAERARNREVHRFTRERFEAAGWRVLPSSANFVMIDVKRDAGTFGWECRRHQIVVARAFPPLTTHVRLTLGTMAEMEEAVPAMLKLLAAPPARAAAAPAPAWMPGDAC
jgi:histidinol-phosphate aminotransferase